MKFSEKFDWRLLLFILGIYKTNDLLYPICKINEYSNYILINIDILVIFIKSITETHYHIHQLSFVSIFYYSS